MPSKNLPQPAGVMEASALGTKILNLWFKHIVLERFVSNESTISWSIWTKLFSCRTGHRQPHVVMVLEQ